MVRRLAWKCLVVMRQVTVLISTVLSSSLEEIYSNYPVYKLKDESLIQATAKLLVKEIEIKDRQVHIHLGL